MIRSRENNRPSVLASIDWLTVFLYLVMVIAGAFSIYAASYDFDNASVWSYDEFSGKQLRWIIFSLFIGGMALIVEARIYDTYAYVIYGLAMLLLLVTPFLAHDIKGSKSWLTLGSMSIQPAEFAKCATALALARLFSGYNFQLNAKLSNYARALFIILTPVVLIIFEKETGSALVFMSLFLVLYREGMSGLVLFGAMIIVTIFVVAIKFTDPGPLGMSQGQFWVILGIMAMMVAMLCYYGRRRFEVARNVFAGFAATGVVVWLLSQVFGVHVPGIPVFIGIVALACIYILLERMRTHINGLLVPVAAAFISLAFLFSVDVAFGRLQPHQQKRVKVTLGIEDDIRDAGYNVNQSMIAIGSGGLAGKGFLEGTQTKLKYVPEQHTDFIFCTIGEEEGFWGTMTVELLFLVLIFRIIHIAERQPTTFARVYAYCVASYLMFHFCINIGMVIGLCPVIGIPLPFFSYGGSSLMGFTILLFILLRLDASRRLVRH